jgi:hypothetical protein
MLNDDLQFESFLRQFKLVRPDPLPLPQPHDQRWLRPILAAAAVLLTILVLWLVYHTIQPRESAELRVVHRVPPTLGALQRLANQQELDSTLDAQSARLLPDVETSHGALAVLAKP